MSMSWESVEGALDIAEKEVREAEQEEQRQLDRLMDLRAGLLRKRRQLEFVQKRADEQFWCLERELEDRGEPNLYRKTRKATDIEKELYGIPAGLSGPSAEASSSPS